MEALRKDVEIFPTEYQWERALRFNVSQRCICAALKRLGIRSKKTLKHPKADEQKRADFQEKIERFEAEKRPIVYLDESGFEQSMPRKNAYSLIGQCCYDTHDWQAKGHINAIGAIINFVTLSLFECSINADVFYAWLTQDLLPNLSSS